MTDITASGNDKLLYLDSLRGIAAIVIAIHHFQVNSPVSSSILVANSWIFLDFFFVLSGFVIALNYQEKLTSLASFGSFQFARFMRIYPLHLTMLLVFLGIETVKWSAAHWGGLHAGTPAFVANNAGSFLHNLALTQNLFLDELSWNKPSWTLSAEFYTYVLFAAAVLLTRRRAGWLMLVSVAVVATSFVWLLGHRMGADESFVRCVHSFFLGAITFAVAKRLRKGRLDTVLILVFGVFLLAIVTRYWDRAGPEAMAFPYVFAGLILLFEATRDNCLLKRALEARWLTYLGVISLGIYLIHSAVWWAMQNVARAMGISMDYLYDEGIPTNALESQWVVTGLLVAGLGITVALAHLSYQVIERPAMRARKRLDPFARAARPAVPAVQAVPESMAMRRVYSAE